MKQCFRNNGLSIVLLGLFLLFWAGQAMTGFKDYTEDCQMHGTHPPSFTDYLSSDHFWEATFENWESEFLQMAAYVVLTVFLYQKGSAESNDPDKDHTQQSNRKHPWVYRHSLSLALVALFLLSWGGHAIAGWKTHNGELREHGRPEISIVAFLGAARFWFESFQNWQSEFLAVASIVILSIWLREAGSPESKDLDAPHHKTGK